MIINYQCNIQNPVHAILIIHRKYLRRFDVFESDIRTKVKQALLPYHFMRDFAISQEAYMILTNLPWNRSVIKVTALLLVAQHMYVSMGSYGAYNW